MKALSAASQRLWECLFNLGGGEYAKRRRIGKVPRDGGGTARGSTAVAAIRTGRRFIGMEKDEHFYKIAVERIAKEREGLV